MPDYPCRDYATFLYFNAGDAWGEWSANTVKDLVGYVPKGLSKYSDIWKSPVPDYTLNTNDQSARPPIRFLYCFRRFWGNNNIRCDDNNFKIDHKK